MTRQKTPFPATERAFRTSFAKGLPLLLFLPLSGQILTAQTDDHGNTCSTATPVATPGTISGRLETGGDIDYFRISLTASGTLTAAAVTEFDSFGILSDVSCNQIASDDDSNGNLDFRIVRSLGPGTYYLAVRGFGSSDVGRYTVTLSLGGPPPPQINPGGVVSAASLLSGAVCAGSLVSIFGTNLASGTARATTLPLPTNLQGTEVQISGFSAPLVFVSPTQINAQVPWEVSGGQSLTVQVVVSGQASNTVTIPSAPVCGGVFTTSSSGTGQGAILIAGTGEFAASPGSIEGANARPVRPGEFITIYATGLGPVTNPPPSGSPASNPLSLVLVPVLVTIGGVPAEVTFAGLAPGFVGLYQINVKVPEGVPTGHAVQVVGSSGGIRWNSVFICAQLGYMAELHVLRLGLPRGIAGGGTVTGPGINCGTTCRGTYPIGTVVRLTAIEDPGWTFKEWLGDRNCSGRTIRTCDLPMQPDIGSLFGDRWVRAVFTEVPATADLVAENLFVSSATVQAGEALSFRFTVRNQGNGAANSSTTLVQLSSSPTQLASTVLLASLSTPPLQAGASVELTGSGTVPSTLPAGTYYIWITVDRFGELAGQNTANDTEIFGPLTVTQAVSATLTGTWVGTQQAFLSTLTHCNPITIQHTWRLTQSGNSVTGTYRKVYSTANPSRCSFLEGTTQTGSIQGTVSLTASLSIATDDGYLYSGTFTATTISIALTQAPDAANYNPFSLTKQ